MSGSSGVFRKSHWTVKERVVSHDLEYKLG